MTTLQPIQVWGQQGPNPPKIAMLLHELGLPLAYQPIGWADLKQPAYLAINPNGRLPAIHDPNTNLTLWESGAIIEYLLETYDTAHKLGFAPGTPEYYLAKQWLFYQVSGQGPYYGQFYWFKNLHGEKVESAIARYLNEIKRVTGVVEGHLGRQEKGADGPWLVGGRYSYVDMAWLMWQRTVVNVTSKEELDMDEFPLVKDWMERIGKREAVKKVLDALKH
ncbi:putative glutathione S-transferase 1 [Lentithecium fluviatile CBS 122367]|uniref:Putative glutathione S-transferase 1 n=1 Tax=Lentithecium fluviatile CBS 122367 TaxID=1168545 RepID=A0A6G1IL69_9PLEO|nr:putative glutathione S-transferase 1 [Lentithecium fluviatile CBS 122367]